MLTAVGKLECIDGENIRSLSLVKIWDTFLRLSLSLANLFAAAHNLTGTNSRRTGHCK